jgi:hypothetical protein
VVKSAGLALVVVASVCGVSAAQEQPGAGQPVEPKPAETSPPLPLKAEPEAAQNPAPAAPEWTVGLVPTGSITFQADLKDSPGSVEIWRAGLRADVQGPLGDRARLSVGLLDEASWYLFDKATGLAPGTSDLFESVYLVRITPRIAVQQGEQWGWFVGGIAEFAGEAGVDIGDAGTYGGFAGANYAFDENVSATLGFGAKTRLEHSPLLLPVFGLDWKVNEKTTVSIDQFGGRVATKLRDDLTFAVSGTWELREYRLDKDSALPKGVVRDTRVPIGASLDWQPWKGATVTLFGGAVVWQQFKIDDRNGFRVSEDNTDPAPFVSLSAKFVF